MEVLILIEAIKPQSDIQGIYQFRDTTTNEIVYIGKDSHINQSQRLKNHYKPSLYNEQQINRVLQNNHGRYEYEVIYAGSFDNDMLNTLEINTIAEFKQLHNGKRPKFNFTDGGEGMHGYVPSKTTREKRSRSLKKYYETHDVWNKGIPCPEHVKDICRALSGEKSPSYKKYARIVKCGKSRQGKQQYTISFKGKKKIKKSINPNKLLKWFLKEYPLEIIKPYSKKRM